MERTTKRNSSNSSSIMQYQRPESVVSRNLDDHGRTTTTTTTTTSGPLDHDDDEDVRTTASMTRSAKLLRRWRRVRGRCLGVNNRGVGGPTILLGLMSLVLGYYLFTLRDVTFKFLRVHISFGHYITSSTGGVEVSAKNPKMRIKDDFVLDSNWTMIFPDATKNPFSAFTPKINVIWSRGWYNALTTPTATRPSSIPLEYFNKQYNAVLKVNKDVTLQHKLWNPSSLCGSTTAIAATTEESAATPHTMVWIRSADMSTFVKYVQRHETEFLAKNCSFSIINSDGDDDVCNELHSENSPIGTKGRIPDVFDYLVNRAPFIRTWYAQNLMVPTTTYPKLVPIPIGLELHKAVSWSTTRTPLDVLRAMKQLKKKALKSGKKAGKILVDLGSVTWCQRRIRTRTALQQTVAGCGLAPMRRQARIATWETYASYDFAVAPPGCGWDTHRLWELLLLGTIPIVLYSSVTEQLLIQAHVPVLVVDSWTEICDLHTNTTLYDTVLRRYHDWIEKYAHYWLETNLWIPRNQARMDSICDHIPGCVEARHLRHRSTIVPPPSSIKNETATITTTNNQTTNP